jgi:hypothetical protein
MEIQRLRTDRSDKPPSAQPPDATAQPHSAPAPARKSKKSPPAKAAKPKPLQDEWGIYDPGQAGFDALFAKIDEVSEEAENEESDDPGDQLLAEEARTHRHIDDPADHVLAHSVSEAPPAAPKAPAIPKRVGLAPLAMWAHAATPEPAAASRSGAKDHLRALMAQLQLPAAVASVSYPTGCRIRHIRVIQPQTTKTKKKVKSDEPLVIVSRKRLRKLRNAENASQ